MRFYSFPPLPPHAVPYPLSSCFIVIDIFDFVIPVSEPYGLDGIKDCGVREQRSLHRILKRSSV